MGARTPARRRAGFAGTQAFGAVPLGDIIEWARMQASVRPTSLGTRIARRLQNEFGLSLPLVLAPGEQVPVGAPRLAIEAFPMTAYPGADTFPVFEDRTATTNRTPLGSSCRVARDVTGVDRFAGTGGSPPGA